ncbi:MAG: KamA family radical SAM protein [Methanosarcinaceae archaeon]|nr:KamA family radical SAM protein [Methanosarcinaceae archaeon]
MSKVNLFKGRDFRDIELYKDISEDEWNNPNWQISNSITTVTQLEKVISLNDFQKKCIDKAILISTPMRITPYYASLMPQDPFNLKDEAGNSIPDRVDPIFRQAVPTPAAYLFKVGLDDPMSEEERSYGCVYQRYPNRVAFKVTKICYMYCNHCQRKKDIGKATLEMASDIEKGIEYISKNTNIDEVLLTGGDPLTLPLDILDDILDKIYSIPHVKIIRLGTRVPVVLPQAVTDEIVDVLKKYRPMFISIHCNHQNEITDKFRIAIDKLKNAGFTIFNQMVALNGVNDDFKVLATTFSKLYWIGVKPYYLLQCHKTARVGEYIVPIPKMRILTKYLRGHISGPAIPNYVVNMDGGGGKVLLTPSGYAQERIAFEDSKLYAPTHVMRTWDDTFVKYRELLNMTEERYNNLVDTMDKFYGSSGKFRPSVNIIDRHGNYVRSTNVAIKTPPIKDKQYLHFNPNEILGYSEGPYGSTTNPQEAHEDFEP